MKSNIQTTRRSSDKKEKYYYSIPPELREAARIFAESTPLSLSTGKHSAVTALMREKHGSGVKDFLALRLISRVNHSCSSY